MDIWILYFDADEWEPYLYATAQAAYKAMFAHIMRDEDLRTAERDWALSELSESFAYDHDDFGVDLIGRVQKRPVYGIEEGKI